MKDSSSNTCTTFIRRDNESIPRVTHFRVRRFAGQIGYINATIIGRKMGCGDSMYVTPLTMDQSTTWFGRWTTCTLLDIKTNLSQERCSYYCSYPGYWNEIQVIKVPRTYESLNWEICHINATDRFTGN
ncbi:hypothetical protein LSH36_338g07065 [Paralvinella palmiformis]|uniref:Uncharacterized protein n=1 Tax=Paralvinella palmiformis TaxID=53620 RepID=A0AAD9JGD9_9ANNE|nr:hypothetical protein LSH36_338g07065 [Paralvinella palmiformis]